MAPSMRPTCLAAGVVVAVFLSLYLLALQITQREAKPQQLEKWTSTTTTPFLCEENGNVPLVVGLMVTGKDAFHEQLALLSVANFFEQTHPNKRLVVVNDGAYRLKTGIHAANPCMQEIAVQHMPETTLGDLRNIAIDAVPEGSYWLQWDDDDWRHETLIARQLECLLQTTCSAAFLGRQLHLSLQNNSTIPNVPTSSMPIIGTLMVRHTPPVSQLRYPNLAKAEDYGFYKDIRKTLGATVEECTCSNLPTHLYVRLIHGHNTWEPAHFAVLHKAQHTWTFFRDMTQLNQANKTSSPVKGKKKKGEKSARPPAPIAIDFPDSEEGRQYAAVAAATTRRVQALYLPLVIKTYCVADTNGSAAFLPPVCNTTDHSFQQSLHHT